MISAWYILQSMLFRAEILPFPQNLQIVMWGQFHRVH